MSSATADPLAATRVLLSKIEASITTGASIASERAAALLELEALRGQIALDKEVMALIGGGTDEETKSRLEQSLFDAKAALAAEVGALPSFADEFVLKG